MIKIGFDIGGVLSKYPKIWGPIISALNKSPEEIEVHVLSDMHPWEKCVDWVVTKNNLDINPERIHSCDYTKYGERCKAEKSKEIGLDVLIDDFIGYVGIAGEPKIRLLVMPDPDLPYYSDDWNTDGSEGNFGRRLKND